MRKKEKKVQAKSYLDMSKKQIQWSTIIFIFSFLISIGISNYLVLLTATISIILGCLTNLNVKYVPTLYKIIELNDGDDPNLRNVIGVIDLTDAELEKETTWKVNFHPVNTQTLAITNFTFSVLFWQLQKVEKVK